MVTPVKVATSKRSAQSPSGVSCGTGKVGFAGGGSKDKSTGEDESQEQARTTASSPTLSADHRIILASFRAVVPAVDVYANSPTFAPTDSAIDNGASKLAQTFNASSGYRLDTSLNVTRLQQFDKTRFLVSLAVRPVRPEPGIERRKQACATSRTFAPDSYPVNPEDIRNYTWWWSSKEYGLDICLPAFEKVPFHLRQNLAEYHHYETWLVGGFADTVYIPHRYAQSFRDTLAIFLETTCFLEIGAPTTLHLVNPRHEPILFVDHWWIWVEPLSATFVRNKWAAGFEVDTFQLSIGTTALEAGGRLMMESWRTPGVCLRNPLKH
ncbi:hypothetical protein MVEN_00964000 [Mycena venus]|uniref:Uncharacterized protein n=1 Tax=Mycena venus TaxID=2733690 RepID=A0A8H6YD54_9AGAR|nr:hypothetical protein MVEN_00964000 [Mycena venus]